MNQKDYISPFTRYMYISKLIIYTNFQHVQDFLYIIVWMFMYMFMYVCCCSVATETRSWKAVVPGSKCVNWYYAIYIYNMCIMAM